MAHALFSSLASLGEVIDQAYRRANYNDREFPKVAEACLASWTPPAAFTLADAANYLLTTPVKQQPGTAFSNLPITVFHSSDFYLECLVWTDATTNIHQHAFSGAFRLLAGSSLHSEYEFVERERVNTLLLLGHAHVRRFEHLAAGDVRQITSGRGGLIHALFHLDQPSITLVARTHGEPWLQPQYTLYPPAAAADTDALARDSRVRMLVRAIEVIGRLDPTAAVDVWCRAVQQLDAARAFALCMELRDQLEAEEPRQRVMDAAQKQHGALAADLERCLLEKARLDSLLSSRRGIVDPSLRFFVALLANATSRDDVFRMMSDRACIEALAALGDPAPLLTAARAVGTGTSWAQPPTRLAHDLVRAKATVPAVVLTDVLEAVVLGESAEALSARLATRHADDVIERARKSLEAYRSLPELNVFHEPGIQSRLWRS